jgi:hypothetical protein
VTIVIVRLGRQETLLCCAAPRRCVQSWYGYEEESSRTTVYTHIYLTRKPKIVILLFLLFIYVYLEHTSDVLSKNYLEDVMHPTGASCSGKVSRAGPFITKRTANFHVANQCIGFVSLL